MFLHAPYNRDQKVAVQTALNGGRSDIENALNNISWTSDAVTSLQSSVVNGPVQDFCITNTFVS